MPEPGKPSVNDRVLFHLSRFATDVPPEEYSPEATQAGIAAAIGISRTHVPRAVKGLIRDGLVSEFTSRVKGHERRMNVYSITSEGLKNVDRLWREAMESDFLVMKNGKTEPITGKDLEELVGRRKAVTAISQMKDGVIDIGGGKRTPQRDLGNAPGIERFYGRETELARMEEFLESSSRMLVILGNKGYGTSTLARRFVDVQEDADVLWMPVSESTSADSLVKTVTGFAAQLRKKETDLAAALDLENAIFVFDDYFSVPEEVVEAFGTMVEAGGETRIIVTARQETPVYNWFYQKKHVEAGVVRELKIKGLDPDSARAVIGNDRLEKDALRRIMMLTHGQPSVLDMLRRNDVKGLKENTVFTPEEIRYLLFLKDKKE